MPASAALLAAAQAPLPVRRCGDSATLLSEVSTRSADGAVLVRVRFGDLHRRWWHQPDARGRHFVGIDEARTCGAGNRLVSLRERRGFGSMPGADGTDEKDADGQPSCHGMILCVHGGCFGHVPYVTGFRVFAQARARANKKI